MPTFLAALVTKGPGVRPQQTAFWQAQMLNASSAIIPMPTASTAKAIGS
jgi:hypothetical protein